MGCTLWFRYNTTSIPAKELTVEKEIGRPRGCLRHFYSPPAQSVDPFDRACRATSTVRQGAAKYRVKGCVTASRERNMASRLLRPCRAN